MKGSRVLITGGAGLIGSTIADQLVDLGVDEIVVLDDLSRGRLANLAEASARPVTVVEGDIRDRKLLRGLLEVVDVLFHQAALRSRSAPRSPRVAVEVLVDGTFQRPRAAGGGGCPPARWRRRRHRSTPRRRVPHPRDPAPVPQPHPLGRRRCSTEGSARSFHEMYGSTTWRALLHQSTGPAWTSTASTPRSWCAGWSASPRGSRR